MRRWNLPLKLIWRFSHVSDTNVCCRQCTEFWSEHLAFICSLFIVHLMCKDLGIPSSSNHNQLKIIKPSFRLQAYLLICDSDLIFLWQSEQQKWHPFFSNQTQATLTVLSRIQVQCFTMQPQSKRSRRSSPNLHMCSATTVTFLCWRCYLTRHNKCGRQQWWKPSVEVDRQLDTSLPAITAQL